MNVLFRSYILPSIIEGRNILVDLLLDITVGLFDSMEQRMLEYNFTFTIRPKDCSFECYLINAAGKHLLNGPQYMTRV